MYGIYDKLLNLIQEDSTDSEKFNEDHGMGIAVYDGEITAIDFEDMAMFEWQTADAIENYKERSAE